MSKEWTIQIQGHKKDDMSRLYRRGMSRLLLMAALVVALCLLLPLGGVAAAASSPLFPGAVYFVGSEPSSLAVADFDGINGPDLAVANVFEEQVFLKQQDEDENEYTLSVLLNQYVPPEPEEPPVVVGGEAYPANKMVVLAPNLILVLAIIAAIAARRYLLHGRSNGKVS